MKYLAIDYGTKNIGIAISDNTGLIAHSFTTLKFTTNRELIEGLKKIIKEEKIEELVLGLPKNMNNTIGPKAQKVLSFKSFLEEEINIKVNLQDERLSTKEGHDLLIANKTKRKNRKKVIDKIAATIILQTFLDRKRNE